ncbi:DNA-binding transcriptional regulator, GntR family [Limimonas halophila]|uniref:DNA-binding transcriptional regulator, GntR family n=1 Tax=Limimonas halophila TaxID=1082479 RepID=A0A1G7PZI0_9PROT|nr:GntR family transcriptional regulator [Limimonas halophila]SDF91666.1 DNA-binding transcriptional regulator, GntR family [Limimonas halophila]
MCADTIEKRSLEDQATDILRSRIVSGAIPLGERLVETTLARRYGLSRGTIRAALRRLVDEALVHQVPYAGYRVVDFSDHDLWELFTLREALEGLGARLAATQITPDGAARIRTAFQALMDAAAKDDHAEANRCDHELHTIIIEVSGNKRLAWHYARVENQVRAYIALSNMAVRPTEVGESHRGMVESICAGDAERAEALARANITPPTAVMSGPDGGETSGDAS